MTNSIFGLPSSLFKAEWIFIGIFIVYMELSKFSPCIDRHPELIGIFEDGNSWKFFTEI